MAVRFPRVIFAALPLLALGWSASGQKPADIFSKAPPDVEEALRTAVLKFYQLHTEAKFRQAESMVCEESKEQFYNAEKRQWHSAEIARINWEPDFKSAKVTLALRTEFLSRAGRMPVHAPMTVVWQLREGGWCHFIPKIERGEADSPWGKMKATQADKPSVAVAQPRYVDPQDVLKAVKVTRTEMKLSSFEPSSDEIEIQNDLPGAITIGVDFPPRDGLEYQLIVKTLQAGQKTGLKLTYRPKDRQPKDHYFFQLRIDPLGKMVPIKVTFALPPELLKQIGRQQ